MCGRIYSDNFRIARHPREIVYAPNPETELALKKQAFLNIDIFKKVLEYYKGSNLPDAQANVAGVLLGLVAWILPIALIAWRLARRR